MSGSATRRALIVSGHFGKGHDTVGEASATALVPLGFESRTIDALTLLGPRGPVQLGDAVFKALLSVPPVYDAFHFSALRGGGRLAQALDRSARRVAYPNFRRAADAYRPDVVLSVFATGAAVSAQYKAARPATGTVVFITDSFAHRLWVDDGIDLYLVTSELCGHAVRRYQPRARVAVVPHPTRPAFYAAPSQADARAALGVPPDARCVLLMSGAWGIGPVAECAAALARAGCHVLAVAGSNRKLEQRVRAVARADPRVVPFGFTDRVPELMAASDVVVSSSGDTCREARVVGRGLVLLDVVPGHGRENLLHELELGNAAVCGAHPDDMVGAVLAFLDAGRHTGLEPVTSPDRWEHEFRAALADAGLV